MKRMSLLFTVVFFSVSVTGCGFIADGPFGWAYTDSKVPVAIGAGKAGVKEGQSCVNAFFGMVSVGNAGIEEAMKSAGIKDIYSINRTSLSIFGIYARQCTVVAGE
jgi:hypothetical protein